VKAAPELFTPNALGSQHEISPVDLCGSLETGQEITAPNAFGDRGRGFVGKAIAVGCLKTRATASPPSVLGLCHDDAFLQLSLLCRRTFGPCTRGDAEPGLNWREPQSTSNHRAKLINGT
jgi:hypothetical protein